MRGSKSESIASRVIRYNAKGTVRDIIRVTAFERVTERLTGGYFDPK